jgi:deazaflavin-dependent oxidoreductase (nitroreductase family)
MGRASRPSFGIRLLNVLLRRLLRSGIRLGPLVLLTVPGRTSGVPRTTPVALTEGDGERWLVANFGDVDWVRNLRAAGGGTFTRGRRTEAFRIVELAPDEAALRLRQALAESPPFIRKRYAATPDSPLEDLEREAAQHPVFLVLATGETTRAGDSPGALSGVAA